MSEYAASLSRDDFKESLNLIKSGVHLLKHVVRVDPGRIGEAYNQRVKDTVELLVSRYGFPKQDAEDDVHTILGLSLAMEVGKGAEALRELTGANWEQGEVFGGPEDGATVFYIKGQE